MKSTSYGTEILCSLWCCHLKSRDVHISICSVLFPATFPSSLPSPHCCQAKPVQPPGSESWFPFIRNYRGEKIPYFSSESVSQPRLLERPTVHVMCNGAVCESRGSGFAMLRQVCLYVYPSELVLFCHLCTQFFTWGYLIRWTREKA